MTETRETTRILIKKKRKTETKNKLKILNKDITEDRKTWKWMKNKRKEGRKEGSTVTKESAAKR